MNWRCGWSSRSPPAGKCSTGCDLTGARFARTCLVETDLRGSHGMSIDLRENEIRGLRVDPAAALDLLVPFGVVVD